MSKEAKARIRINELLHRSGWRFFNDESGPANIALEANAKLTKKKLADEGYSVMQENEDGELVEQTFFGKDFETVPVYGMKIDRKFFERFEDKVKAAPEVRARYERGDIQGAEDSGAM